MNPLPAARVDPDTSRERARNMSITKHGSAVWTGGIRSGSGTVSTESGVLDANPYGFNTRFEGQPGTNPEELIGASHAACYAMATSLALEQAGVTDATVEARSDITLDKTDDGFTVTRAALTATVSGKGNEAALRKAAEDAKAGCPISKLLRAEVTLDLTVKAG